MKRALALAGCGLLLLAAAGSGGCRGGARRSNVEQVSVIEGISMLEFDGLNLRVRRATSDGRALFLVVNGRVVQQAELHVGDGFVITDGQGMHKAYHLLGASGDQITLKRQEMFDRRATREGIRTVESVIAVTPYNLEDTD